jgi:hypothetical protein
MRPLNKKAPAITTLETIRNLKRIMNDLAVLK